MEGGPFIHGEFDSFNIDLIVLNPRSSNLSA